MKLFPHPWEGAHPLLPKREEPDSPAAPLVSTLFGLGTYGLARLIGRAKTPGTAMLMIGTNAVLFYGWKNPLLSDYRPRARAAYEIFEKENLPKPPRHIFRSSVYTSVDDCGIAGAVIGLVRAASTTHFQNSIPRRLLRSLGCGTAGFAAGALAFTIYFELHDDGWSSTTMAERDLRNQTRAANEYRNLMGKDPPYELYPLAAEMVGGQGFTYGGGDATGMVEARRRWGSSLGLRSPDMTGETQATFDKLEADQLAWLSEIQVEEEPLPDGTFAFKMTKVDGEIKTLPERDYDWQPESTEQGIIALRAFIDWQSQRRADTVQSAEYLYRQLVKWEKRLSLALQNPVRSEADEEEIDTARRASNLLSGLHSRDYHRVATIDWLIADAKKHVLQLQSNGDWMPAGDPVSYDPKTYSPQRIKDELGDTKRKLQITMDKMTELTLAIEKDDAVERFKELYPGLWEGVQADREEADVAGEAINRIIKDLD